MSRLYIASKTISVRNEISGYDLSWIEVLGVRVLDVRPSEQKIEMTLEEARFLYGAIGLFLAQADERK